MNDKPAVDGRAARWAPVIAGAATAGLVVGQASSRMGVAEAAAIAVIAGLAVALLAHTIARILSRRA